MRRTELALIAAGLACLTIGLYWPATNHDFINFDDPVYIANNPHVNTGMSWDNVTWAFGNSYASNWIPLTWISLMLDVEFQGLSPKGFHVTNILLHALNVVLLFFWLFQWSGKAGRSCVVAALFAVHPLHVESVAWIAERKDVLSTSFVLLCLLAYTHYRLRERRGWLIVSCVLFAFSLMAKQMYVTLPFLLLVFDFWPLNRETASDTKVSEDNKTSNSIWRQAIVEKIPFLILAISASVIVFIVQSETGAVQSIQTFPFGMRLGNVFISYCLYLKNTFWPTGLAFYYPFPANGISAGHVALSVGLLVVISASAYMTKKRFPYLLVGWLWFVGTLIPVIGIVQIGTQRMADRYMYFPQIGLLLAAVWGASEFISLWGKRYAFRAALTVCVVFFYANSALTNIGYWKNNESLYRHAMSVTENNDVANTNLGLVYLQQKNWQAARQLFERAIEFNPNNAHAHNTLGTTLVHLNQLDQAESQYKAAIAANSEYALAYANLGNVYRNRQQFDAAIENYEKAIRLSPDMSFVYNHWGIAMAMQQNFTQAIKHFSRALELAPGNAEAKTNLARGHYDRARQLLQNKEMKQAAAHLQKSIQADPGFRPAADLLQQLSRRPGN